MKKKALTTVALGAATLAAGMAGNVHADSVKVTKQQIGDETKITTTTTKDVNQQKIAQDKQNISSQQTVVNSAKSSLDKAKANASSASQVVSSAQSKVNDTKKALDTAKENVAKNSVSGMKQQVANDQSQVNTDKQNISSTQSSITADKNNIAKDQQAINNVGQKVQQDQKKLSDDQKNLENANQKMSKDTSALNNINKQINDVKAELSNTGDSVYNNTIKNPGITLNDLSEADNETNLDNVNTIAEKGLKINSYVDDPQLENIKIDLNKGLSTKQIQDLSEWTATLLNEFRKEIGINSKVIVTVGSAKVSQETSEEYNQSPASGSGHNNGVLMDMQKRYGFPDTLDEDLAGTYQVQNLNDVYKAVYNGLLGCLFNDKDNLGKVPFGHLLDLSGYEWAKGDFWHDRNPNGDLPEYLGVSMDKLGWVHYNLINAYEQRDAGTSYDSNFNPYKSPETMDMTVVSKPKTSDDSALKNKLNSLTSQASQLQDQVNKDKQVVNDLQNQVNADKAQLQKDTPAGLQQQLQNDQKKLANDQATLQKQQQKLAQDEAQLKANQSKLNSITPEDIANAQKALEQAQTNYNNAVKALNDAQSKANVSNDELAKAQQNYINALNKLNELKQILENDEKQITTTSVQWIKNQHPTTTSSMGNKVVLHSSSKANASSSVSEKKMSAKTIVNSEKKMNAKSAVNSEKKVNVKSAESNEKETNTVHADTVSAVKLAQADAIHFTSEAPVSSKKAAKKNALPQMGDENSNKTVWGEISLAMAGVLATLGLADRKRRN